MWFNLDLAFALELIALACGGILLFACHFYSLFCHRSYLDHGVREYRDENVTTVKNIEKRHDKEEKGNSLAKFIAYFVIILSFISLVCTTISYIRYWMNERYVDEHAVPTDVYRTVPGQPMPDPRLRDLDIQQNRNMHENVPVQGR